MINNDDIYKEYYDNKVKYYQYKHPKYNKKRLHLMALKKTTIRFANTLYNEFNQIKEVEDYERLKYDNISDI